MVREERYVAVPVECYRVAKNYNYWWFLAGLAGGIVLCLIGLNAIN